MAQPASCGPPSPNFVTDKNVSTNEQREGEGGPSSTPCGLRMAVQPGCIQLHEPPPLPLHCPRVEDVEPHPLQYQASRAVSAPQSVIGCRLVLPLCHPRAAALQRALTVEAPYVPSLGRRPKPTLFYEVTPPFLRTSKMAFVAANVRAEVDARVAGDPLPEGTAYTNPRGLFPFQRRVCELVAQRVAAVGGGLTVAPCGTGKSEMIGAVIGACGVKALVMVPKCLVARQLVLLFRARFPRLDVRRWDGSHRKAGADTHIIVAVTNSAASLPKPVCATRGLIVVDEAHHVPAQTVQNALARFAARCVVGFTATPYRSDGCEAVFPFMFGPLIATVHRPWMPVIVRGLRFMGAFARQAKTYNEALNMLCENAAWTSMVLQAVLGMARRAKHNGGRVLVMVDRARFAMELCAHAGGEVTAAQWARLRKYETNRTTKVWRPTCTPAFADSRDTVQARFAGLVSTPYVGVTMTETEREAAGQAGDIVWSTNSMANEGLNLDNIHKEALFCKPKRPQQHVGRCLRITTMADVPEVVFSVEPRLPQLHGNAAAQAKYFAQHEGWPVDWVPDTEVGVRLAQDGTAPTCPTPQWDGHARKRKRQRKAEGGDTRQGVGTRKQKVE